MKYIFFIFILLPISIFAQKVEKALGFSIEIADGWEFEKFKQSALISSPDLNTSVTILTYEIDNSDPLKQEKDVNAVIQGRIKSLTKLTDSQIRERLKKENKTLGTQGFFVYSITGDADEDNEKVWVTIYYSLNKKKEAVFFVASAIDKADEILPKYWLELDNMLNSIRIL